MDVGAFLVLHSRVMEIVSYWPIVFLIPALMLGWMAATDYYNARQIRHRFDKIR